MKPAKSKKLELRKFVRLPVPLPVKFRSFDIPSRKPSNTTISGRIRNISLKGLCLETNTALIKNRNIFLSCIRGDKLLQLDVKLPNTRNPLRLRGKVLWFNNQPPGSTHQFSIGIYITEAPERSHKLWVEFVEEHKS